MVVKIPIIEQRGLINFKPRSQLNVVGLCPNCHTNYNDHRDPNVAFYPTDLQFLIRFELRDRARRGKESPRERITPTAAQYVRQCGLYNRIQLDWKGLDTYKVLEPAAWNGAPLATIPRTFAMMSCPRVGGIPKQDREDLSSSGTYTTAMMTRKWSVRQRPYTAMATVIKISALTRRLSSTITQKEAGMMRR